MPVTYSYDGRLVIVKMTGNYSLDEIQHAFKESLTDPDCPAEPFLLADLTDSQTLAERSSVDVISMTEFASSLARRFGKRIAVVVPHDFQYGIMRMEAVRAEEQGVDLKVFRRFDEARRWITEQVK